MTKIKSQESKTCEHAEFWKLKADDLSEENRRLNVELQRKDEYIRKLENQLWPDILSEPLEVQQANLKKILESLKSILPAKS